MTAWKIELEDRLRFNPAVRNALCRWKLLRERPPAADDHQGLARSIHRLCAAARLAPDEALMRQVESEILARVRRLDAAQVNWPEFEPDIDRRQIEKAAVLKPFVSEREKGVLFVSFEYQWARLMRLPRLAQLARRYTLVVSPTWCPPHSLVNFVFPAVWPGPVFCLISNRKDLEIFPRFSPGYVMVPLLASAWVNPGLYQPRPFAKKDVDIFMLANFGKYKRHHALFRALRDMPAHTRVLLIGQHNGPRSAAVLRAEARAYGVEGRFELVENAPNADVLAAFSRAKTSLILSRREGSCVAVVESLFANTPVGLLADAEIGSAMFINEQTGRFLRHENLGRQLTEFVAEAGKYTPRRWAEENRIDCLGSTATLNDRLKEHSLSHGQSWTQDIAAHHWRPDPQLLQDADRLRVQPACAELKSEFGLELGNN